MDNKKYLLKNIDKIVNEAMIQIARKKYKKAEEICNKEITRFYREYSPFAYKRKYDLYNAYNLDITRDGEFIFELGSEFMQKKHRVNNDYIFEKMFKEGWHGGAHDGAYHPDPGKHYWRTPMPSKKILELGITPYSSWYPTPAPRSTSPYENILRRWNMYMNTKGKNEELSIWSSTFEKYIRR